MGWDDWYEAMEAYTSAYIDSAMRRLAAQLRDQDVRVRARRYNVLNRNVWWNRAPMVTLFAASDSDAATALLASLAGRTLEES